MMPDGVHLVFVFFFFQAEDGIRDVAVTGVQTCALPISHILRCGVLEATPEHQKEWFDDTMLYLAERYVELDEQQIAELRVLGERYCRPVVGRNAPAAANVCACAPRRCRALGSRAPFFMA